MVLYRADRRGRKTKPESFATDGLLTKQVNSGDDPEPHNKYGWLTTITSHLHKKDKLTTFIYNTTAYLSFTTDPSCSDRFLAGEDNMQFTPSGKEDANGYVFEARIDLSASDNVGNGIFEFPYVCNYFKLKNDPAFQVSPMLLAGIKCNLHQDNAGLHKIRLIDAVTYLQDKQSIYPEEFANASRDREWLLMPYDPMPNSPRGFQSRIAVADFWTVKFYSLR